MVKKFVTRLSVGRVRYTFLCAAIQTVAIPVMMCVLPNFWEYLSAQFPVGLYCAIWFVEACIVAAVVCIGMGMNVTRANVILFLLVDVPCFMSSLIIWLTTVSHI